MMIYFTFFINIQPHWWMKFGSSDHLVDFFSQEKKNQMKQNVPVFIDIRFRLTVFSDQYRSTSYLGQPERYHQNADNSDREPARVSCG
jgi:hypothetical protein